MWICSLTSSFSCSNIAVCNSDSLQDVLHISHKTKQDAAQSNKNNKIKKWDICIPEDSSWNTGIFLLKIRLSLEKWGKWQPCVWPMYAKKGEISTTLFYFCMMDMLIAHMPAYSSPVVPAALPSSPLRTSPQRLSPAAMPPSPVWVCLADYAIPPAAGCVCMQDGVHAHHPESSETCMQTAEPEDWHKKHKGVLSKLSQRRNSS